MVTVPLTLALVGAGLAGCQTATAPREFEVRLHGEGDDVALTYTAEGCRADARVIQVDRGAASSPPWLLVPDAQGLALVKDRDVTVRIVDEPGPPRRRAYLDPLGVPLARVTFDGDRAAVSGPDRSALGSLDRVDDAIRWLDADGRERGRITGELDLELAAALVVPPTLPTEARAVLACSRLVALAPPASTRSNPRP